MPARSILMAIALSGWLVVSIVVFMTVAYAGFFAVGLVGLMLWFVCTLVELDTDGTVGHGATPEFIARQVMTKAERSRAERAASLGERVISFQSVRFYRNLGAALTVVGAAGFLLFQV